MPSGGNRDGTHAGHDRLDQEQGTTREGMVSEWGGSTRRAQGGETFMERRWSVNAVCAAQTDPLNMEKSGNADLVIRSHWEL